MLLSYTDAREIALHEIASDWNIKGDSPMLLEEQTIEFRRVGYFFILLKNGIQRVISRMQLRGIVHYLFQKKQDRSKDFERVLQLTK